MTCQNGDCGSDRIVSISGKTSDLCSTTFKNMEHNGYVPKDIGLQDTTGDYIVLDYCLTCGQIQGKFPITKDPNFFLNKDDGRPEGIPRRF